MTSSKPSTTRSLAGWFLAYLSAVFLLFAPYLGNMLDAGRRQLAHWQTSDSILLVASLLALALLLTLMLAMARTLPSRWPSRGVEHLVLIMLAGGLLTNLYFHTARPVGYRVGQFGVETRTLWLVVMLLVGWSLARPGTRIVEGARRILWLLSPACAIVGFQLLTLPSYPDSLEPLPSPGTSLRTVADRAAPTTPVYWFILDAWSYDRTYQDGRLRDGFPRLAEFSDEATTFHRASAAGDHTETAVPRMFFNRHDPVAWGDVEASFQLDDGERPTCEFDSVFAKASQRGYRTFTVGFCVPYRVLLGDQVDVCRAYPWLSEYEYESVATRAAIRLARGIRYWTDPWFPLVAKKLRRPIFDSRALAVHRGIAEDVMAIIRDPHPATFAYFHVPLPHSPYLFNEDGSYRGTQDLRAWQVTYAEGYERNLGNTDRFVGEVLETIKQAGHYNDALIVLTADHPWQQDPLWRDRIETEDHLHVPLIVKLPHQRERLEVDEPVQLENLSRLILQIVDARPAEGEAESWMHDWVARRQMVDGGLARK